MSFPRYPDYKCSGLPSVENIPSTWTVKPVKAIAQLINGYPFESSRFNPNEGHPIIRIRDLGKAEVETRYSGDFLPEASIDNKDVLIGMDGDFNVGRWLGQTPALLNQRVCCVRASNPSLTRYLEYALPAPLKQINEVTYATTVKHLSSLDVLRIKVSLPLTEEEIEKVVSFLDRETAKIDALIAEQQHLVELLQEKRQAVISHAVTKGLNPNTPMKDSGVEWLGEVPEHWVVTPLRLAARIESGHTPSRAVENYWIQEECVFPWFTLSDVWQIRPGKTDYVYETKERVSQAGLDNSAARLLPKGTVILSRTASVGYSGILGEEMATTQDFVNWICGPKLLPEFLLLIFRGMKSEFERIKYGSTHNTIYMPDVYSFRAALPPLEEQAVIVAEVRKKVAGQDQAIDALQNALSLLHERRSALISAGVTGQIDVRGLVEGEGGEQ